MRLTEFEKNTILKLSREFYGQNCKVRLFGSRVDDSQKGGDIDLLIEPEWKKFDLEHKFTFLVSLKSEIGDQKIDLVLDQGENTSFMNSIKSKSILLQ